MRSDSSLPVDDDADTDGADDAPELDSLGRARRALLGRLAYVPPAIIGTLLISSEAQAQEGPSCTPNLCEPNQTCGPGVPPCEPYRCEPFDDCGPFPCGPWCGPRG